MYSCNTKFPIYSKKDNIKVSNNSSIPTKYQIKVKNP